MNILWVKIGGLWPPNTGGRLRSFHLLAELSRQHRVTVLTTHTPQEDPTALARELPYCERVVSLPYAAPKWRTVRFVFLLLRSWFSRLPVELYKYRIPAIQSEIEHLMKSNAIDICIADFLVAVPNVRLGGAVPVIFFAHNVEHVIWKRICQTSASWWQRPLLALEWRKMRRIEAQTCQSADLTVAVSDIDLETLKLLAPQMSGCAIATGVDTAYFSPSSKPTQPLQLVFTGSMDWQPNEDAILYFIAAMLPTIRNEFPDLGMTVVGRNPGQKLQVAARNAGIDVTGTVPDIRPFVAQAQIYVVPLRIGGGTRIKIYEALAMGKAVVSTTIGAEGLPLLDGIHFVRADTPTEFAQAVIALLRDPERCRQLGTAGRDLVEKHFAWHQVARDFELKCLQLKSEFSDVSTSQTGEQVA